MDEPVTPLLPDPFKWVGGRLCLDFVNTVGGRIHGEGGAARGYRIRVDKLRGLDDLARWNRGAAYRPGPRSRRAPAKGEEPRLARAVELREALYRIFRAVIRREPVGRRDLERVSGQLRTRRAAQRLVVRRGGIELAAEPGAPFPEELLGRVAESAAELLTGADRERLRQCPGEDCGWLFVDDSRNGRRRWCDMRDCGNRAKVQRFRRRERRVTPVQ